MFEPRKPIQYFQVGAIQQEIIEGHTIVESPVALTVNGKIWTTFMCTPVHLEALMIGFLFNEGVIESMEEIAEAQVCEHGDNVDIWLTHEAYKPDDWTRTSGCTGGVTAVTSIEHPRTVLFSKGAAMGEEFTLSVRQINRLVGLLFEVQELYHETGGVHTSALSDGERVILSAEDIGRHNTLDKIAGLRLMQNIQLEGCALITTGRISSEMLQKAVRMGANVLISCSSPSSFSIDLAEAWGVTLIGYARQDRFNVYAHPERILVSESRINIPIK